MANTAAHFATPADYHAFRLVTAIRQGTLLERLPAQLSLTPAHHLVTADELRRRFRDLPEAIRNSDALAEQLRSDVLPRDVIVPKPALRHGQEPKTHLKALCDQGLRQRGLEGDKAAEKRLERELELIKDGETGFLVPPADAATMAKRIEFALAHADQSDLIAMRGRRFVIERFGMERMVAAVERLYDEIIR